MSGSSPRLRPGFVRRTVTLLGKELLLEWRTRTRLSALIFFSLATLLLFSFAIGPNTKLLKQNAGGYLWLALVFASVLALGEALRVEHENAAIDGLRAAPAGGQAIFVSKALASTLLLLTLCGVLVPALLALYGPAVTMGFARLVGILVLGCLAISAPGILYSGVASYARSRDVLLPLLLFPLLIPAMVAAGKATTLVFEGDPMSQLSSWVGMLAAFDVIYWSLGILLFPLVIED